MPRLVAGIETALGVWQWTFAVRGVLDDVVTLGHCVLLRVDALSLGQLAHMVNNNRTFKNSINKMLLIDISAFTYWAACPNDWVSTRSN